MHHRRISVGVSLEEAKEMCKDNYAFFQDHLQELYAKYPGRFLIIKDSDVVDTMDSFDAAFNAAKNKYELGSFLIQECTSEIPVLNFATYNVSFAEV